MAALGLVVIEHCLATGDDYSEAQMGMQYGYHDNTNHSVNGFIEVFVEPFYEYLDEQIDDQRAILSTIKKFKHSSEWFKRQYLFELHANNREKGEEKLAFALYEYLHDQGLDFVIEPKSKDGRIDLILSQPFEEKVMAEAKIYDGKGRNTTYICKGFNQTYQYVAEYNQPFGYLIVFNISEHELSFATESDPIFFPYVNYSNKVIYLIVIDLFTHEESASKRGKLKSVIITEEDLITPLKDVPNVIEE